MKTTPRNMPHSSPARASRHLGTVPSDDADRLRQLSDIAESGDHDNAECAAADLAREFPHPLP